MSKPTEEEELNMFEYTRARLESEAKIHVKKNKYMHRHENAIKQLKNNPYNRNKTKKRLRKKLDDRIMKEEDPEMLDKRHQDYKERTQEFRKRYERLMAKPFKTDDDVKN